MFMDRLLELKELGYDVEFIIDNIDNPKVLEEFYSFEKNQDIELKPITKEDYERFVNRVYEIVKRSL